MSAPWCVSWVAFLLLLAISSASAKCKLQFHECRIHTKFLTRRTCQSVWKYSCLPSSQEISRTRFNVTQYCTGDCRIRPVWCAWGEWTKSEHECGEESGKRRRNRRKACHPQTQQPLNSVLNPAVSVSFKKVPWTNCDDEGSLDSIYPYLWSIAIASCIVILVVCIVAFLCCRYRTRSPRRRPHRRSRQQPPRVILSGQQSDPRRFPQESATTELTRPSAPPEPGRQDALPPSYTLCTRTARDSLPPQYEDALKLVK